MIDLSHLSPAEAIKEGRRLYRKGTKRHKYGAQKTSYGGQVYDSRGEAGYAHVLDQRMHAGEIAYWRRGRDWVLVDGAKRKDRVIYRPDFEVLDARGEVAEVHDFKGVELPLFKVKAKLFKARYPHIPLVIVRANGSETRL